MKADVVVIGGGIVGFATALQMKLTDPHAEVVIVEKDPTYAKAATGKGTGGIRQLFTRPENIALSQYTLDIVENWGDWAAVPGVSTPDLKWRSNGYLFIAGEKDVDILARNYETQRACGVDAEWIEPAELGRRYPEIRTDDLRGAVLSSRDGWLDPKAFFEGVQNRARHAGVTVLEDEVQGLIADSPKVTGVRLASGPVLTADAFVNTAGTWAPGLAAQLGMDLPVEPMRRHEHYAVASKPLDHLPFIKDIAGLAIHAHLGGVSVGLVDFDHPGGEEFTIDPEYYAKVVEPALAHRISGATDFREQRTWTGLYDQNRFDGNAIVGNWQGRYDNFYVAAGFSGHGFMHALGVGRAIAEHITTGKYLTIDLTPFGYQRVGDNAPYAEIGIR
ncbi:NAD(P)/FAD-dependent oxidoreductase [Sinomonas mesophila]|uniref:NAD(P)/FAD-dependent oxidoreductase n=1 Tax=Sinomonas mesophila TaxID=1531955 RepID=UPI00098774DF|nr:FAD-dependent oxidoreductase [Sinomonas mesophila]